MSAACNFDSKPGADLVLWHGYSDCIKDCYATGCPDSKLGNGVCDQGNFKTECNSNECAWDWGDCGYCAEGCLRHMLENNQCDAECNVDECGYDDGFCVRFRQVGLCSADCSSTSLGNGRCDPACYTKACNYDATATSVDRFGRGDCKSCISAFRSDFKCQPICNTQGNTFDNSYCLCNTGCNPSRIGNKRCDYECLTLKCLFNEVELCEECAPGCPLRPETCMPECLTADCKFNSGGLCSPVHWRYSYQKQLRARNLRQVFDLKTECLDKHPECTLGNLYDSECQEQCNNEDCLYDMYTCETLTGTGNCGLVHKDNLNECVRCGSPTSSRTGRELAILVNTLYTACVANCPNDFSSVLNGTLRFCLFNNSKYKEPGRYFITSEVTEDYSDGSEDYPYTGIWLAMTMIRREEFELLLLNGEHIFRVDKEYNPMSLLIGMDSPLNYFGELNPMKIEIKPAYCSEYEHLQCVPDGEKVVIRLDQHFEIDAVNTLIISNITFIGSFNITVLDCGNFCSDYMNYCANIRYDASDDKYYDDRNQEIYSSNVPKPEDCRAYHERYFIDVHPTGNLIIQNSDFIDFRQELKAIIYSRGGNISLQDVEFSNIRVASNENSAVIYGLDCAREEGCGTFKYNRGSVSLLNNGYEYSDYLKFSGFIAMKEITKVTIEDVEFDKNLVYVGRLLYEESRRSLGVLMYLENSVEILLNNLKFTNNYLEEGILKIITNKELSNKLDEENQLINFYHDHIHLENLEFRNNFAVNTLGIKIEMSLELLNILIKDISFEHNFSQSSSFISISQLDSTFKDIWLLGGSKSVVENGQTLSVQMPKRKFSLEAIKIKDSISSTSFLSLKNLANIDILDLDIRECKIDQNLQSQASNYLIDLIEDESTYIQFNIPIKSDRAVIEAFVKIANTYKIIINHITFLNNSGATLFKMHNTMVSAYLSDVKLENNLNDSEGAIGMDIIYDSDLVLNKIICTNNRNEGVLGYGVIKTSSIGNYTITISESKFIRNSASTAGAIAFDNFHIASFIDCEFVDNSISTNKGGAMVVKLSNMYEIYELHMQGCKFDGNTADRGTGGAIFIDNLKRSYNTLLLTIVDSDFINGFSELEGSCLYISDKISLNEESIISNSAFSNNISNNKGTLYLAYFQGTLTLSSCRFDSNYNMIGLAIYFLNKNEKQDENSYLIIHSSSFTNHTGKNVIYMEGIRQNTKLLSNTCLFSDNNSTAIDILQGYWEDSYSTFRNNTSKNSAVLILYNIAKAQMKNSLIEGNTADTEGGAMYIFYRSEFVCDFCVMRDNRSRKNGGAIYLQLTSKLTLSNCTFIGNSAEENGSVAFIIDSEEPSSITTSLMHSNNAVKGGTIFMLKSYLELTDTTLSENTSDEATGGLIMILSNMNVYDCIFSNQTALDGVFFHISTYSTLNIYNSILSSGTSHQFGGAIYSLSSTSLIENSEMSHNAAESGGVIYAFTSSNTYIQNSKAFNNSATESGGVIKSIDSRVEIRESNFQLFNNSAVDGENLDQLYITNSAFSQGSSVNGGSILCIMCYNVAIQKSSFKQNQAVYGGAIHLSDSLQLDDYLTSNILRNLFIGNIASNGGAVYLKDVNAKLVENTFESNSAVLSEASLGLEMKPGMGGGAFLICPDSEYCEYIIEDNTFSDNHAYASGGAFSWNDVMPMTKDNIYKDNKAVYGNDISSYPVNFTIEADYLKKESSNDLEVMSESYKIDKISVIGIIDNIASGQVNKELNFTVKLLDHYGNVVSTDGTSQSEVLPSDSTNTTLTGDTKIIANKGTFTFDSYIVSAKPGTMTSIIIQVNSIDPSKSLKAKDGIQYSSSALIELNMRLCIIGESITGRDCVVCKKGSYSLDPYEGCELCDDNAICYGNYTMVPKKGYWRSSIYSDLFIECLNPDACIGSEAPPGDLSLTGECASGYTGNLCHSCEVGYSRTSKNMCSECPSRAGNILKIIGLMIIVIIICVIMVYTTMRSALKPKSLKSIYFKILLNHFQLVSISASFNLDWPNLVLNVLQGQQNIGVVTDQIISIDCLLFRDSNESYAKEVYYTRLIIAVLLPLVIIIACTIIWGIISCYKYSTKYLKQELVASIIILLFLAHSSIVQSMFSIFNCMELDPGEYWLLDNLDIRCWDDQHNFFALAVSLPGIIVWVIGVPTLSLIMLYQNRKKLSRIDVRLKFAFLFNGYKQNYYYWEFVILYRKIILITCAVFFGNSSIPIQALTVMIILIVSLHLQYTRAPYMYDKLNVLELRSIMVVSTTIYSGLYFMTNDLSYEIKILFFVLILASNTYFIYYWIFQMIIETKIYEIIPYFKARWSKKIRDTYNPELFVSHRTKSTRTTLSLLSDVNISVAEESVILPEEIFEKDFEVKELYMKVLKSKISNGESPVEDRYLIPDITISEDTKR